MSVINVGVKVRKGNVEKAISIFKKRVKETGILQEYRSRQEYIKPSAKKRKAKKDAEYRLRIEQQKNI